MSETDSRWQVQLNRQPEKMLRRLPKNLASRIDHALMSLGDNPLPPGSVPLIGLDHTYRIRVGDWRIVYIVENDKLIILVIRIAPRGSAHQNL